MKDFEKHFEKLKAEHEETEIAATLAGFMFMEGFIQAIDFLVETKKITQGEAILLELVAIGKTESFIVKMRNTADNSEVIQ